MTARKPYVRAWQRTQRIAWVLELVAGGSSVAWACKAARVSVPTWYRWVKRGWVNPQAVRQLADVGEGPRLTDVHEKSTLLITPCAPGDSAGRWVSHLPLASSQSRGAGDRMAQGAGKASGRAQDERTAGAAL